MQRSKRFPFTERENIIIRECVKVFGEDWEAISARLPGRTPKQIHDRYVNYLRIGLTRCPWSKQEDDILIQMFNAIGPKWTKMMINLPGRSGNDIKNRWYKHLMKKTIKLQSEKQESIINSNIYNNNYQKFESNNNDFMQKCDPSNRKNDFLAKNSTYDFDQNSVRFTSQIKDIQEESNESPSNQIKLELQNFDFDLNIFTDYNQYQPNKPQNHTSQNNKSIKIKNKFDIMPNSAQSNELNNSNKIQDITSTIFKPDYEIQEILEDLNSRNIDFPWI